jgi:hypothetical protein
LHNPSKGTIFAISLSDESERNSRGNNRMNCKVLSILGLVLLPTIALSLDRAAEHQARLTGLNLSTRALMAEARPEIVSTALAFSETLVSLSLSPARFEQDRAQVVRLTNGGWLAAWDDNRQGSRKIFWQRFDSLGNRATPNVLVAGSTIGNDYVDPRLVRDTLNRIYLFYRDQTAGMIYGQRYTSDLQLDLATFLVNDTSGSAFAGPFDMAVFPDGQMAVVWEEYSGVGSTIALRLYLSTGNSLAGPLTVNSDGGAAQHWVPAVAVAPGSGLVVAWEDYRNGQADIYACQFDGAGIAVGSDFALVPPPSNAYDQYAPDVTYSAKDKYVIGWTDKRQGQEIYLQRYSQTTGLVGSNVRISGGDTLVTNSDLNLTVSNGNKTMASWADFGITNRILGLKLDSGLVPTGGGNPVARNMSGVGRRWSPAAAFGASDNYAVAWTEYVDGQADIHMMIFTSADARRLGQEIVINDDSIGAPSTEPFVVATGEFYSLVLYTSQRHDAGDIYLRSMTRIGTFMTSEWTVNQDTGSSLQSEASAASSSAGILITWIDSRSVGGFSGQRIYGRRMINATNYFNGDEFMISDTTASAVKASPKVAMAPDGRTLVAWIDHRNGSAQVWGRWLTTGGAIDGTEFIISNTAVDSSANDLWAGVDAANHFYVAWLDIGMTEPTPKCVWYNQNHSEGGRFDWPSAVAGKTIEQLSADVFPNGDLALFWIWLDEGKRSAHLSRISSDGTVLVAPTEITDDTLSNATDPAVAVDNNGNVSMTWVDRRDGRRAAYYQILDDGLVPIGVNLPLSSADPEFMATPSTDATYGWGWFTWIDPRANGLNVYASSVNYDPTDVEDDPTTLPGKFALEQNYPNPFNPSTVISFTLPTSCEVSLDVYNILGRRVCTLSQGVLPAGDHSVVWDGTDSRGDHAGSGVYFYKLTAGSEVQTRKMMLLK